MKGSHKTQTCMPLKLATTRDCGGGVQFNAVTTGISITQRAVADRSLYVSVDADTIRRRASLQLR